VQLLAFSNATTDNKAAPPPTKPAVGEGLVQRGPLLITKQGMSGPAVLKLSAFGARLMSDAKYR
jgi:predicted flavoprotein YhiN